VRTPRGKGRRDGALHEITALSLAARVLGQLRDRDNLDTRMVDDVIPGCVSPVGEQGSDIARTAVLVADYAGSASRPIDERPGFTAGPFSRSRRVNHFWKRCSFIES